MITVLYCIVVLVSTTLGALVGLGGGVIIKPVLDLMGYDTVDVVSFLSAVSVFAMSIAATVKHITSKTKFDVHMILLIAAGAAVGGYGGNVLFDLLLQRLDNEMVKGVQGLILGLLLVAVTVYLNQKERKTLHVTNSFAILAVGLFLGLTASFLGIGGGPINVAVLVLFFGMQMKEAAIYSVATIFFSQLAKLATIYAANQFQPYDLSMLLFLIPAAVLGGVLGAKLNKSWTEKRIRCLFTLCVSAIALINFYNAFQGLFG